ncbi:hypothetical protein CHS0354_042585 [Potamilus streckersoni]|uniref:Uncharacterized protein n=1 Tax=Potamilus streckersoni TaxID=2493646 RepID=A0AAE0WBY6_9BIVA|nr:hypothetical protein CHS0354_042585 [Potamilus streckersoni]
MSPSNTDEEIQYFLRWFDGWNQIQKGDFLKDLVGKTMPDHVDTLFESMRRMDVRDRDGFPSIFQAQLQVFTRWYNKWAEKERNDFMIKLQQLDPSFVAEFNEQVTRLQRS